MPVKDRCQQVEDAKSMVQGRDKANKNAAGMGALRRIEKEKQDMRKAANGQNFCGVSDGV